MSRRALTPFLRRVLFLPLLALPTCGKKEAPPAAQPTAAAAAAAEKAAAAARSAETAKTLARRIEDFTGARTKIVWAQFQSKDGTDPRSNQGGSLLMGLDTRDALGARPLLANADNYSRPLISADGGTILYTRKTVSWDSQDVKHYSTAVMRTDWKGGAPIELAGGYATCTWVDPETHIEWVYAVRGIKPSPLVALEGASLVRFQLAKPGEEEVVWSDSTISPDNIQLSHDGRRASGLAPWPAAGLLWLEKNLSFQKLGEGSWPSIAPDDSYASFVFDDKSQSLSLFCEGRKPWTVPLTTTPHLSKGEVYHPRWTNHPRFITLTGPYARTAGASEGSAVGRGGLGAEVFIGRFSEKLDQIDGWLRVTDNALNDHHPAVWLENGGTFALSGFTQKHDSQPGSNEKWLPERKGALFLWQSAASENVVRLAGDREVDCTLEQRGIARYGRAGHMIIDGGSFSAGHQAAGVLAEAVQASMPVSFEFVLHLEGEPGHALANLASLPHARLSLRDGIISAETPRGIIGVGPVQGAVSHVTLVASDAGGYSLTLTEADGKSSTKLSAAKPRVMGTRGAEITFGGGNGHGAGISHAAVFARALDAAEIKEHAGILLRMAPAPRPAALKLRAKLAETAPMPAADGSTRSLIDCIYEVLDVTDGAPRGSRIFVRHWAIMDGKVLRGFPRRVGLEYDLSLEDLHEHPEIKNEPTSALKANDLEAWFDVDQPSGIR